jgi:two-component system sensor histidine kinase PilS (NtrC family)
MITVLLGATITFNLQDSTGVSDRLYDYLYNLCTIVYLVCFAYTVLLRLARSDAALHRLTWVQLSGDVLFAAALVMVTGGTDSAFTFFFSLVVIGGAIVLFRAGAIYIAGLSSLLLLLIGLVEIEVLPWSEPLASYQASFLPRFGETELAAVDKVYRIIYNVSVNGLAFFGVAFLASWLSEQLRRSAQEILTQAESLRELRALYRHIVSSVPSGLVTIDRAFRITSFNRTAETVMGQTSEQVLGTPISNLVRDLKFVLDNPRKLERVHREESVIVVANRRRYLGWSLSPLRDASDALIGYIFMFQDVTRVKELERSSYRAEKLAAIGELSAAIAHEIRNPLAAMSGSIQLLQNKLTLSGTEKRLMNIVLRETEQLNKWITDFLEYSRPPKTHRKAMDLNQLVEDAITVFRQDDEVPGAELHKEPSDPIWVLGDDVRIRQVVWNLMKNAAQAMPEGGDVTVELTSVDNGSRALVELAIKDQGVGIPSDELEKIFQPFFTTKERGTGLGLAVVHQIISDHDGRITVDSEPGTGTTFRIALPLCLPPVREARHEQEGF